MSTLIQKLRLRGLIADVTSSALEARCETGPLALYCGFDPTAPSLHVGNLLAIVTLLRFREHHHRPIALVGGATGLIGDPSGRSTERPWQDKRVVEDNAKRIAQQLATICTHRRTVGAVPDVRCVNNIDFYRDTSVLDFVGRVGRHIRVSSMLAKESVRARMATDTGISYAEFSYQIFQAYDFHCLHERENCLLQIGGSDQWGNITAGIDLIHRLNNVEAYGLTLPLITDTNGQKFGKSAGNAVWLSAELTKPFDFYQFFVRVGDTDVGRLLKYFTFLPLDEIDDLMARHEAAPGDRLAQKRLAESVTQLVHGEDEAKKASDAAAAMYGTERTAQNVNEWVAGLREAAAPLVTLARDQVVGVSLADVAVLAGLCASKGEAKRLVAAGGLYLNRDGCAVQDALRHITEADLVLDGSMLVLRSGKRKYCLVSVQS